MLTIAPTTRWQQTFPGGCVGLLEVSGVDQTAAPDRLVNDKQALAAALRERYGALSRADILTDPVMAAYAAYYKQFKKTYHVLLQLESIAHKDRSLPTVTPLVDISFMTELETGILTAGHDVARLQQPVGIDATDGTEGFTQMNGHSRTLRLGDMAMTDAAGVICTIIYGQDNRSPITSETTAALYVAYAPVGIGRERVQTHLARLATTVQMVDPGAVIDQMTVVEAPATP